MDLPAAIGKLANLKTLDLQSNQLRMLPAELGQLVNLSELDVSSNCLSALPPELGQLRAQLRSIRLGANPLQLPPLEVPEITR